MTFRALDHAAQPNDRKLSRQGGFEWTCVAIGTIHTAMNNLSPVISERFWSRVSVGLKLRCWNWRGVKDENGYGKFRMEGKTLRAPRVAFWLRHGHWPENACHKCDNPTCCNPDHLFDGTRSDNMQDMVRKGRHLRGAPRGEAHGSSVLTNEKVHQMRAIYALGETSISTIAKMFDCTFSTVQRVISRKSWRHI